MQWEEIINSIRPLEDEFNKSYKCISQNRAIKEETLDKHINILIDTYNTIRAILHRQYNLYTKQHKEKADEIFLKLRDRLIKIFHIHKKNIKAPLNLSEEVNKQITEPDDSDQEELEKGVEIEKQILQDKIRKIQTGSKMDVTKLIDLTSKILPEFDGRFENLQKFLDALTLLDSIKESHEQLAVQLIHTKISGNTRTQINGLNTIGEIINKLKSNIKGESPEIITSKLMATRQSGKTNTTYAQEIENLCKSLNSAYIADGLSEEIATKYVVQTAVKSVVKNASSDRTKLIIEAGTFTNVEQIVAKLLNSQQEQSSGNLLHFSQQYPRYPTQYRGRFSSNRGHNNYRGNTSRHYNNSFNNHTRGNNNNNRQRGNNRNNRNYNHNNRRTNSNRSVLLVDSAEQENYDDPRHDHLGEI